MLLHGRHDNFEKIAKLLAIYEGREQEFEEFQREVLDFREEKLISQHPDFVDQEIDYNLLPGMLLVYAAVMRDWDRPEGNLGLLPLHLSHNFFFEAGIDQPIVRQAQLD